MPKKATTPQPNTGTKAASGKAAASGSGSARATKSGPGGKLGAPQLAAKAAPAKASQSPSKATAKSTETARVTPESAPAEGSHSGTVAATPTSKPAETKPIPPKTGPNKDREDSKTVVARKAEAVATKKAPAHAKPKGKGDRAAFLASQRQMLLDERSTYIGQAEALKAQADSLALEHEPGDVQFDEEGGEGGTANVDREIDLYLSAQARATVVEIDRALQKIEDGTYGLCEQCGDAIPDARLQALPYAALCVTCKSGGLSSRR
jgi:DnaK suppressor protein